MEVDENFEQMMHDEGVAVISRSVDGYAGLLVRKAGMVFAFVNQKAKRKDRTAILAEEYGHYMTSTGDSVRIDDHTKIGRTEERALRMAIDLAVQPDDIIRAIKGGVRNWYELSDYLDLPEWFLRKAVAYWKCKFGPCYCIDKDVLWLDPLSLHS